MRIELLEDYRGIKINDALWLKGIYDVADDLGDYLISKGYARAIGERDSSDPVQQVSEVALPDGTTMHVVEKAAPDVKPDGIAQHNQAVDDLGLPSHLKVKSPATAPDDLGIPLGNLDPDVTAAEINELVRLQAEYEALTGDAPDGRWGINRLHEAILELAKASE